jgi:hypothetical protein
MQAACPEKPGPEREYTGAAEEFRRKWPQSSSDRLAEAAINRTDAQLSYPNVCLPLKAGLDGLRAL